MQMDEAIRELYQIKAVLPHVLPHHKPEAIDLGIEALKAWKDKRLFSNRLAYYLLPGENEQ